VDLITLNLKASWRTEELLIYKMMLLFRWQGCHENTNPHAKKIPVPPVSVALQMAKWMDWNRIWASWRELSGKTKHLSKMNVQQNEPWFWIKFTPLTLYGLLYLNEKFHWSSTVGWRTSSWKCGIIVKNHAKRRLHSHPALKTQLDSKVFESTKLK